MTLSQPRVGTIGYDTYGIVPRGASAAMVKPVDIQIRTIAEYDISYLRDRLRADLFINGLPAGIYAVADISDELERPGADSLESIMRAWAPGLEQMIISEMFGHKRHEALKAELAALRDYVERDRWFQFLPARRWLRNEWLRFTGNVRAIRAELAEKIAP